MRIDAGDARIGRPQCGQASALGEMNFRHSGHGTRPKGGTVDPSFPRDVPIASTYPRPRRLVNAPMAGTGGLACHTF